MTKPSQRETTWDTVLGDVITKSHNSSLHYNCSQCCVFGAHALSQHLHGVHPVQTQAERVQHIQRPPVSSLSSPESRATNTILLSSAHVSSYTVSSLFSLYMAVSDATRWLMNMNALSNWFFPSASPFLLLNHDSRGLRLFSVCCRRNAQIP